MKRVIGSGRCGNCNGAGVVYVTQGPFSYSVTSRPCASCSATGTVYVEREAPVQQFIAEALMKDTICNG